MRRVFQSLAVLSVVTLAACSGPGVGSIAPAFTGTTSRGLPVSLEQHEGKVLVLDFWAVWCPTCIASAPQVQRLHESLGERPDATLVGVHYDDNFRNWDSPQAFLDSKGYSFPTINDGGDVRKTFGVGSIPRLIVVGTDGKVIYNHGGLVKPEDVDRILATVDEHLSGQDV